MLVSASVCALFFTILVWCNSHTWIYFKHKGKYVKVSFEWRNRQIKINKIILGRRSRPIHATVDHRQRGTRQFHGSANLPTIKDYPHSSSNPSLSRNSKWSWNPAHASAWTYSQQKWNDGTKTITWATNITRGSRVSFHLHIYPIILREKYTIPIMYQLAILQYYNHDRYGHIGTLNRGVGMGPQGFINPGHGTLGRPPKPSMQGYST